MELCPETLTVFTEKSGKTYRLKLAMEQKKIVDVISQAIEKFNKLYDLQFATNLNNYLMFAAKKSGKIHNDFPTLDLQQNVILTNISFYFLKEKAAIKQKIGIRTQFVWEAKKETKAKETGFCKCLFGL